MFPFYCRAFYGSVVPPKDLGIGCLRGCPARSCVTVELCGGCELGEAEKEDLTLRGQAKMGAYSSLVT